MVGRHACLLTCLCLKAPYFQIRTPYKTRYGKDLEDEIKKAFSGDFEDFLVALLQTPTKLDVTELNRSVKGLGTNEKNLIEILTTRTNEEIEAAKLVFKKFFEIRSLKSKLNFTTTETIGK